MKKRILQYAFLGVALIAVFSSCRKQSFGGEENPTAGKTFVWITEANSDPHIQFFDVFTDIKTVALFTVRRDAANNADLKKAVTVTLTADPDSTANAGLTPFTSGLYTFPTSADIASGGIYAGAEGITANSDGTVLTVNFAPGEFAKNIIYKVDGSKLDLSNTYGAVWKITNFGGFTGKVGYSVVAAGIAIKNQYDGVYDYTGTLHRDDDLTLGGPIKSGLTLAVSTASATQNLLYALWADGSGQIGGVNPIRLTTDPATNKVTVTSDANATLRNIPDSENSYNPATRTFTLNFVWNGSDPAHRSASVVLSYKGSR